MNSHQSNPRAMVAPGDLGYAYACASVNRNSGTDRWLLLVFAVVGAFYELPLFQWANMYY